MKVGLVRSIRGPKNLILEKTLLNILLNDNQKFGINEIRRARLLELCEDEIEDPGESGLSHGKFERCLRRLEAGNLIEIQKKGKKMTVIKFDVRRIKAQMDPIASDFEGWRSSLTAPKQLEEDSWEKIIREGALLSINDKSDSLEIDATHSKSISDIAKSAACTMASTLISRSVQFYDTPSILKENDLIQLGRVAANLISQNPSNPFKITIEFTPISQKNIRILFPEILQNILGDFEAFVNKKYGIKLTELEKYNIRYAKFNQLDSKKREYFDAFYFKYLGPIFAQIFKFDL